ncbi:MAG: Cytosol aminopeptidase PepA [uncultured Solirubrobacteraceae bacterium]|uniref:Probable cytosol aminopeptidase n=1 Tax=uncultured Solirubrobacteraceae bacterium TaxID=1162706 RepID=A0A6J4TLR9_9ACTN|nr:MAG: Cytosol aminopeptidase PepA [uncultured Solirubrobacteraceae bacterium]
MIVECTTALPQDADADTVVVGVLDGEKVHHDVDGVLNGLVSAGEAKAKHRHLAVAHAGAKRWVLVGLGKRDELDGERVRLAAASALGRARELGAKRLCWEVPHKVDIEIAAAVVEGTLLTGYRFERFKSKPAEDGAGLQALVVSAHDDLADVVAEAEIVARAVNAARNLQNTPANEMAPRHLADAARVLGELDGVTVEVEGRDGLERLGMGSFAAVARGSVEEPALITLRYEGPQPQGPVLGLVGKAVTFDSGGISIKNANKMFEMKFDMSGGAAVLGAIEAIAELKLPVRVVAVVGATENMPAGNAVKPGDVVTAANGTTIEIINTDAEGRLVLADCLTHAVNEGAERLVDIATLTGSIITALGNTHAGLFAGDDDWAEQVAAAGSATGETVWRLPLHDDYAKALDSDTADLMNVNETRKAGSSVAAQFLLRFTAEVPWAHLDIAGTAWGAGKPYAAKGGSGWGVRLFVELARSLAR